jgi:hypothetical protein
VPFLSVVAKSERTDERMAVSIVSGKGCVFSVWGRPKKEDMDLVLKELRETADISGGPVAYVTRVPANSPAPDAEVRRHLDALMPEVVKCCSTYHVVLEGKGFVAAIKRTVLSSLFQIGWKRGLFFVHAFPSEVVHNVAAARVSEVTSVLERAKVVGLFTTEGPASSPPPAPKPKREQAQPTART